MTKKELEKEFKELETYADNLRKSNEQLKRSLDDTKEQLRIAKAKEKEWRQKSANDNVERDEWKKMALHLMEQLLATKAKLEVANLPF